LISLLGEVGAFHDCPSGNERGSIDSASASYASRFAATDMVEALAHACRSVWLPLMQQSPVIGELADETGDDARRAQLAVLRKIVVDSKPVLVLAGMTDLQRGTADVVWSSLKHVAARDSISYAKQLAFLCLDTCSTMFGCTNGVATRMIQEFPCSTAVKCVSHKKALGLKHAFDGEPFLVNSFVPDMVHAGRISAASNKKHEFLKEANEKNGTMARSINPPAFTRWDTWDAAVGALGETAEIYNTQREVFARAGKGGAADDYVLDAGAADPTAHGIALKFSRQEHIAVTTALLDILPMLRMGAKKLESWSLNPQTAKAAVDEIISELEKIATNFNEHAKRGSKWREFVEQVKACGTEVKATAGRTPDWIDRLLRRIAVKLVATHKELLEEIVLAKALAKVVTVHDPLLPNLSAVATQAQSFEKFYSDSIDVLVEQYCEVPDDSLVEPMLSEDDLRSQLVAFGPLYVRQARHYEKNKLPQHNRDRKAEVDKHNKRVRDAKNKIEYKVATELPQVDI
jgi:hypothetical protein